ncbi:hypothetical protein GGH94_001589 [Coemansia aciculifera]|uniref:DUF8032 domain-containing protein n=1 Tax=Coemansia aciculifera TaxID=417176 RepID=A0A9W8ISD0_9FUNG|nr:hypothetical protein GGH94_001589 [Coemansia aciculifera]
MLPRTGSANHTPPPAPPGSAASEGFAYTHNPASSALDGLFAQGPLDIDVLSELLGSLDPTTAPSTLAHYSAFAGDTAKDLLADAGDDADEEVEIELDLDSTDLPDYSGITTESVLFGLRSLDDFERQAAIHTEGRPMVDDGAEDSEGPTRVSAMEVGSGYDCLTGLDLLQDLSDHTPSGSSIGLGSFNEAELSAALEQIYWSSLEMPLPTSSDVTTHDSTGLSEAVSTMAAPTPTSTPVSHIMPPHSGSANIQFSSWTSTNAFHGHGNSTNATEISEFANGANGANEHADSSDVGDEDDDDDDDDENPLELEELSLFSLFLSDMAAFESFLGNLSLNQLRQCATTVNSVLVRREATLSDTVRLAQPSASRRQHEADSSSSIPIASLANGDVHMSGDDDCEEIDWTTQLGGHLGVGLLEHCPIAAEPEREQSGACLPSTTLALLREWLPPSTADCVITALQAANLAVPLASNSQSYSAATTGSSGSMSTSVAAAATATSSSRPKVSMPIPSADARAGTVPSEAISRRVSNHYYSESTQTNEPLLETGGDDVPWLSFVYAQKGKPKRHRIRIDIERAPLPAIPSSFQANNCVYPRANCAKSAYTGNRWAYETECNGIGWKLAFLNQELLSGRRGLLQTAVNNYRTIVAGRKSRRIARLEKAERTQHASPACEARTSTAGRLAYGTSNTSSSNKRSLPQPVPTTSMAHGESSTQAETIAPPGDKRAKLTHHPSDNTTSRRSAASAGQASLAQPVNTVLPTAAIGDSGPSGQPVIRVNEGTTKPKSPASTADAATLLREDAPLSAGASAPLVACARVSGPSQSAPSVASQHAKCLTINAYVNSKFSRIRINIDLGTVDSAAADARFKNDHAVFPRALNTSRSRYGALQGRWEFELTCNELAWRLAWLNKGRLKGRKPLIQKCLDAYRIRFSTPPWNLLPCYRDLMNESVDPHFFDYWTPRPGRLRLTAESVAATQPLEEQVSVASDHHDSIAPPSHSVLSTDSLDNSATAVLPLDAGALGNHIPTNSSSIALRETLTPKSKTAEQPCASGSIATADDGIESRLGLASPNFSDPPVAGSAVAEPSKHSPSGSGSESAARMRIIRPKSGSGLMATIAPVTPVVPRPVNVSSPPPAHIARPTRPIARPLAIVPASGSQTRLLDTQPPAASRPVISSDVILAGSTHSRPRPPPAHLQASAPKRPSVPATSIGNRPPSQLPMLTSQPTSPNNRGARPTTGLSTGQPAPPPAPNQHSRPSRRLPAPLVSAVASQPAPANAVSGAKSPLPSRVGANLQRHQRQPATAFSGNLLPRPSTAATSPPAVRRRHTDAPSETPGSLAMSHSSRSNMSHSSVAASHIPAAVGDAAAGTNRSTPSARIQATAKAHVQNGNGSVAIPPVARSIGSEKSVKAQVAADMLTDVLRRLAKTDPSLAPLAGVLGKSHPDLKSKAWPSRSESNVNGDDDDDDAPLDAKVAELEKLIIDLQNN